ncbi:AAA family ATPase [Nodularia harveyana]
MEFTPGINIIVGRNNAGKTSLLELLTLDFESHPHKSIKTLPNKTSRIQKRKSSVEIIWQISTEEVRNFINDWSPNIGISKLSKVFLIRPEYKYNSLKENPKDEFMHMHMDEAFEKFKNTLEVLYFWEIKIFLPSDIKINNNRFKVLPNSNSFELISSINGDDFYKLKFKSPEGCSFSFNITKQEDADTVRLVECIVYIYQNIVYKMFEIFYNRIYRFKAERLNVDSCKAENNHELKSDASNLAEVLFILQGRIPGMFAQFNELVSIILPEIKWISVVQKEDSNVEIMVWNLDPKLNRDDLSLPLSSCGSGVGQVLAILYILVSSEEPRTLIIDEPQSFLHPGAARKLIEIIKQFPQHQYFIATHSPEIITAANPSNIIKLQYQDCETKASVIDSKKIESQNAILDDLGVRLSDVFGADNILWVEGQTEEKCFPLIIENLLKIPLMGTKILSVHSTDALLDGKRSDLVFDIYQKLTTGASLFPTAMGFIFDRESKTERKIQELEKKGVKFLQLPMYENYLLVPEAISAIINQEATWLEELITSNQVQQYLHLDRITKEKEYLLQGVKKEEILDDNWLLKVHGAKVLEAIFRELCDSKLEFRKTKHSPMITEWLIKNQPESLCGLSEELKICLNKTK